MTDFLPDEYIEDAHNAMMRYLYNADGEWVRLLEVMYFQATTRDGRDLEYALDVSELMDGPIANKLVERSGLSYRLTARGVASVVMVEIEE